MPIRYLLDADPGMFGPEDLKSIVAAFEDTLRAMRLVDRSDPAVSMVAKTMIDVAKSGERDPAQLRDKVMQRLSA
jgi:hypothetical protein